MTIVVVVVVVVVVGIRLRSGAVGVSTERAIRVNCGDVSCAYQSDC